jgi:hypothetical protein
VEHGLDEVYYKVLHYSNYVVLISKAELNTINLVSIALIASFSWHGFHGMAFMA